MADDKKKDAKKPVAKAKAKKAPKAYKPGKACPKCGAGNRLAEHKNRRACGKCGYFEKK